MVEHDAIAGEQTETLAVIHRQAVRENLGSRVRAGGMEGGLLVLQRLIGTAEHFTGPGLEVAGPWRRDAQRFQHVCGANRGDLSGQQRLFPRHPQEGLGRQIVDLVRLYFLLHADQRG